MLSAVRTIARREVRETLTDWRILAPIFILTFVLPQVLIGATSFAIGFIGEAESRAIIRLIPFAMLLVGFIPASFSLITALESFVGERERNSLESLLAMPISDASLYVAKLIAALLPPLLSSLMAMCIFALSLRIGFPDLFFRGLPPEYFFAVIGLITAKALMMVAGAVIISSHTTSIRAANLLASFVLLPTAAIVQLEALLMISNRWDIIVYVIALLVVVTIALIRTGMSSFNREEILSREHEQLQLKKTWGNFRRYLAEYQPPGVVPADYTGRPFSLRQFYRTDLPALLRDYRIPIALATGAALAGLVLGGYIGRTYAVPMIQRYLDQIGFAPGPSPVLGLAIAANNIRVAFLSNAFSMFSFGAFAFLVPSVAFAQIGFVATKLAEMNGGWGGMGPQSPLPFLIGYVLPHGIIELPTAILSAALGLRMGVSLLSPPAGFTVGQNMLWALAQFLKVWALVLVPLFLISGLIEGLISPLIIQSLYR